MDSQKENRSLTVAALFLLLAGNAFVCWRLFFTEYTNQLGSVDGFFIAISRYAIENPGATWSPMWFGGMPYESMYGPVLHHFVALVAVVGRISPALAFHIACGLIYCIGPAAMFWMTKRLTGSLARGFWVGLFYSFLAPSALMVPAIRADITGFWLSRRLHNIVVYGDAPHMLVLALLPFVLLSLDISNRRRKLPWVVLSAALLAIVALTSVTGAVGFFMALAAFAFAVPREERMRWIGRLGLTGMLAYCFAAPWIVPSALLRIWTNSHEGAPAGIHGPLWRAAQVAALVLIVVVLNKLLDRFSAGPFIRFSTMLFVFSAGVMMPATWWNISLVPQPARFHLEMEMGFCLMVGCLMGSIPGRWQKPLGVVVCCLLAVVAWKQQQRAAEIIQPVEITTTAEYKYARWFDENMGGRRVFAPGSVSFWMNVFTGTPQVFGCCEYGIPNFMYRVGLHTVYTGQNLGSRDAAISLRWLRAFGVHAVGVSGPGGGEHYKSVLSPFKFEGLLPVLWRDGGDVIYALPQRSRSLAHVIRREDAVVRRPRDGSDVAPLERYLAALEDERLPLAGFQWVNPGSAIIESQLRGGDLLSVQVSYAPGWRAEVNGTRKEVSQDSLGMILIDPQCSGSCKVDLVFDGGAEMAVMKLIRNVSILACLFLLLKQRVDKRRDSGALGKQ